MKHGKYGTRVYGAWAGMAQRCTNPNNKYFRLYGGRGIKVCERWALSLEAFLADMGEPPSPQHTLDRIDSNGDYEPGNCRWATAREQARNRTTNRYITYRGQTRLLIEWCEILGQNVARVRARLGLGWDEERALTAPLRHRLGAGRVDAESEDK